MGNLGSVAQLAFFAGREPPPSKLLHNTRGAIGAFEFLVYGTGQRQHLALRQTFAIRRAAAFPRPIAADADIKHIAHFEQRKQLTLRINPGVLPSASFAKYAAAFFMISSSRLSRRVSARSRESSISSSVTALPHAPTSRPAAAAFTQLRKVWSPSPSSLQTIPMLCPPLTRLTASSLNSRVDACLVSSISCLPKVTSIIRHPWQTKLRGKVSNAAVQKPSPPWAYRHDHIWGTCAKTALDFQPRYSRPLRARPSVDVQPTAPFGAAPTSQVLPPKRRVLQLLSQHLSH